MTRKSKREIERDLEELTDDHGPEERGPMIVFKDESGDWYREPDDEDPIPANRRREIDPIMVLAKRSRDQEDRR